MTQGCRSVSRGTISILCDGVMIHTDLNLDLVVPLEVRSLTHCARASVNQAMADSVPARNQAPLQAHSGLTIQTHANTFHEDSDSRTVLVFPEHVELCGMGLLFYPRSPDDPQEAPSPVSHVVVHLRWYPQEAEGIYPKLFLWFLLQQPCLQHVWTFFYR